MPSPKNEKRKGREPTLPKKSVSSMISPSRTHSAEPQHWPMTTTASSQRDASACSSEFNAGGSSRIEWNRSLLVSSSRRLSSSLEPRRSFLERFSEAEKNDSSLAGAI